MGRTLIFVPDTNTPGKNDVTGAFLPEATLFARFRQEDPDAVIKRFPAHGEMGARRAFCIARIRELEQPVDTLAFFCHGYHSGIQAGFTLAQKLTLAQLLAQHATVGVHVLLYACNAGDSDGKDSPGGDGGFADELRDALERLGRDALVLGHTTAGHCSYNPYVRRFAPGTTGQGGEWYVRPGSRFWGPWVRRLRDPHDDLRWRLASLTPLELERELSGPLPVA
jgi:hypothetical protein